MSLGSWFLEHALAYRAWQAPFAEQKFAPIRARNDLARVGRVLDVGCGPGTNTHHFATSDYLGIDINPRYVAAAARRTGRAFIAADATAYTVDSGDRFDFILLNSFLHHIDTPHVTRLLRHLAPLLSDDGHVHILDLLLPAERSVARILARGDRGDFPRPLAEWRRLFTDVFAAEIVEPYSVGLAGVTLWNMVYFKGRRP